MAGPYVETPHGFARCLGWALASILVAVASAHAQDNTRVALSAIAVPGGLAAAREAIADRASLDRAVFLAEVVQRFYNTPRPTIENETPELQALLTHLGDATRQASAHAAASDPADQVPLPLTHDWWTTVAFRQPIPADGLALAILQSRDAALLYWALLAMDEPTRLWFSGRSALVEFVLEGRSASLVQAVPGFRVASGAVRLPGGELARPAWEALVRARASIPDTFIRRILSADEGRLAYFFGSLALLSDEQLRAVLHLDDPDEKRHIENIRRLYRVFGDADQRLDVAARPFTRMPLDPLLVLAEVEPGQGGATGIPGDEGLWKDVFDARGDPARIRVSDAGPTPVDIVWLLEKAYDADAVERALRIDQLLFARRVLAGITPRDASEARITLTALGRYPALVRTLERLHVNDVAVYATAVRRAESLRDIVIRDTQATATIQFQGALALLARAALRGSIAAEAVPGLVSGLAGVETSDEGAYEGRVARWIEARLRPHRHAETGDGGTAGGSPGEPSALENDLVLLLAGQARPSRHVAWEGTRYRVDLAAGELVRLQRARGPEPASYLSAAWALLASADRIAMGRIPPEAMAREAADVARVERDLSLDHTDEAEAGLAVRIERLVRTIADAAQSRRAPARARLAVLLRAVADDLTARGLMELAYAAALGGDDASPLFASDAASRHDFGLGREEEGTPIAWRLPVPSVRARGPWHLEGSLLALDIGLAERWLTRVSNRPLTAPPSMDRSDRRALVEVVTIVEPGRLSDADRDLIAAALRTGRLRLQAARSEEDATAIAEAVPVGGVRRTLLPWVFTHDRARFAPFLSTWEVFRLGLQNGRIADVWGAPVRPRIGCLCLQLPDGRAPDAYRGFLSTGIIMSHVPDLNLRLAELLSELRIPSALLPQVLAAATLDLVNTAPSRFPDDVRGIVEQIQALTVDQVEQYLATLTTDGPLVPDDTSSDAGAEEMR